MRMVQPVLTGIRGTPGRSVTVVTGNKGIAAYVAGATTGNKNVVCGCKLCNTSYVDAVMITSRPYSIAGKQARQQRADLPGDLGTSHVSEVTESFVYNKSCLRGTKNRNIGHGNLQYVAEGDLRYSPLSSDILR